jgi:hypothetical protein
MVFIIIVLIAVVLYIWGYKTPALVLFFFFLTSGFNLIPEDAMDIGPISKGGDFGFVIMVGILLIDYLLIKNYLRIDNFVKCLIVFGIFLLICIVNSKWILGLGWSDILRTCRYQFFWLTYFIFRNLQKEQLEKLLYYLFHITVILSVLYLLQIILDTSLLNEGMQTYLRIGRWKIPRYYNQPDMLHYFAILSLYCNPRKGIAKKITAGILVLALLCAFHRSLIGLFVLTLFLGYVLRLSRLKRIRFLSVFAFLMLVFISYEGVQFTQSRTYRDLKYITNADLANVEDFDLEVLQTSTFSFRIALVVERHLYLTEHPKTLLIGAGLIPEDSHRIDKLFDFHIGLPDELTGRTNQVDSGDISYSSMILHFGYIGTVLYLFLYIYLAVFFYRKRENKYGLSSFLYCIFALGDSLFSANLLMPVTYILPAISYLIIQKDEKGSSNIGTNVAV